MTEEVIHFGSTDIDMKNYDVFYKTACGLNSGAVTPRKYKNLLPCTNSVDEITCNNCMETNEFKNAVNEEEEKEEQLDKTKEVAF